MRTDPDAIVVGSGPNGLVAAATLAQAGWKVLVLEAQPTIGGGLRSAELTEPGFVHDVCSAVHPLGVASPALRRLSLADHGLRWAQPDAPLAHPLDGDRVVLVQRDIGDTATGLGQDGRPYQALLGPLVGAADRIVDAVLDPLHLPRAPVALARFGALGLLPAVTLARRRFTTAAAHALTAGLGAHASLPLERFGTAGYALVLWVLAHHVGWPIVAGGSQRLADALVAIVAAHGGTVITGSPVRSLDELPPASAVVLDVTPHQLLRMARGVPSRYRRTLSRFRYGPGVFKVDWALDGPIPWRAPEALRAATVHVGGSLEEIAAAERAVARGEHPDRPFVIVVQPTLFDPTRAPPGRHVAWGYCRVPNGSPLDRTDALEGQIERFAPGFRDRIIARHVMGPAALEAHNANCVGGDITGGATDLRQMLRRPVASLRPWVTPLPGVYLASASTWPGPGVHGMCGWHAAQAVLRRHS